MYPNRTAHGTILRPGPFATNDGSAVTVDEETVRSIAESYDAKQHQAPLVHGRPQEEEKAFGRVKSLSVDEDGRLAAEIEANDHLAYMLNGKELPNHSVGLCQPGMEGNPTPGNWSLTRLGFLGGTPPAVKGPKPFKVALGEMQGDTQISLSEPAAFAGDDEHQPNKKETQVSKTEDKNMARGGPVSQGLSSTFNQRRGSND